MVHNDRLKIFVSSPPVDDMANKECIKLLSKALRVSRSDIKITSGKTSRNKTVVVTGTEACFIKAMLIDRSGD